MLSASQKSFAANIYLQGRADCDALGERFLRGGADADILLDVGCGSGSLTLRWARAARASQIIGLDFVDSELEQARREGIDARKADLSMKWPVADDSCDVAISSQNIEHMHRTLFYLGEMKRVIKPGGRAIILTENLSSWANIAALLLGLQPFSTNPIEGQSIGNPFAVHRDNILSSTCLADAHEQGIVGVDSHVRVLAYQGLREAVERVGMRVRRYNASGYAPFSGAPSRLLSRLDPRHAHFLALAASKS